MDPRNFQILALVSFLFLGVMFRDFSVSFAQSLSAIGLSLLVQEVMERYFSRRFSGWKSAVISGTSLALLLRSGSLSMYVAATVLSVASKFLVRYQGKHIFNPSNFALAILLLFGFPVWVSPGQWGNDFILIAYVILIGLGVAFYAERLDVSLAFLLCFALLLTLRVTYLGQNPKVILHTLSSGSLVLFTFFMISDPRTTPNHRAARILFGCLVAALFYILRFRYYLPNALFYSLFFLSPLVPVLDRLISAKAYSWFRGEENACLDPSLVVPQP